MGRVEKVFFGLLVAYLVGIAATIGYVLVEHATRCGRFDFHAADWRAGAGHRNETANRLVECHRLEGLRADQLRARLGRPEERGSRKRGQSTSWTYDAGLREGYSLTAQTLEVDLNARGRVARARMVSASAD
jgi:hypothetical protein